MSKELEDMNKEPSTKSQIPQRIRKIPNQTRKPSPQKYSNNHLKIKEDISIRTDDPQKQIQIKINCQINSKKAKVT